SGLLRRSMRSTLGRQTLEAAAQGRKSRLLCRVVSEARREQADGIGQSGPGLIHLDQAAQEQTAGIVRKQGDGLVVDRPSLVPLMGLDRVNIRQLDQWPRLGAIQRNRGFQRR